MDTFDIEVAPAAIRVCGRCHMARPLSMFYLGVEERGADLRNGSKRKVCCRVCQKKANYLARKPKQDAADRIKVEAGCVDCGLKMPEHPEVFEFDHLPGFEKTRTVSSFLASGTLEGMLAEIAKCEVVCANCHRIRTRSRGSNYFGKGWKHAN